MKASVATDKDVMAATPFQSRELTEISSPGMSPVRLALAFALAVFFGEMGVMLLLNLFPGLYPWARPLVDSAILLVIVLVPVYFLIYRPMLRARQELAQEALMLSRQLIQVVDGERERLARDIHDDAGQYLAALKMAVATLERTPGAESPEISKQIKRIDQLVDQTRDRVHEVVFSLRPPDLEEQGLVGALSILIGNCARRFPQATIEFTSNGCEDRLDYDIDTALYRICQESLCNAMRHGRPRHVRVEFRCDTRSLRLRVQDDGDGFVMGEGHREHGDHNGVGLHGMQERITAVGGTLQIDSRPGQGTVVEVLIPVSERAHR